MMREAIRKCCVSETAYQIVAEAATGTEAIAVLLAERPDIVVLDLSLPDLDGFGVVERVSGEMPALRILGLSAYCDDYTLFRVEKDGFHGFVDKGSNSLGAIMRALAALAEGKTFFSPIFQAARLARRADPFSFEKILSEAQQAVLGLVALGLSDEEIAARLGIAPLTARTHRRDLFRKLHVHGTPKLISWALEHGFARFPRS